jgi:hypothetical protein
LYADIAGTAQQAGQSALAAAGVAPGTTAAVGGDPLVAQRLAGIGGAIAGYVPAAAATSTRMLGASQQNLTRALAERAQKVSEATARYLQQLRGEEVDRALAVQAAEQNAARLGFQEQQQSWEQQMDMANLALGQERVAQGWFNAETSRIRATKTGDKQKDVKSAKDKILNNVDKWTSPIESPSGTYEWRIEWVDEGGVPRSVSRVAATANDALRDASALLPPALYRNGVWSGSAPIRGDEQTAEKPRSDAEVIRRLTPILVGAGMNRQAAIKWIRNNVLGGSGAAGSNPVVGPAGR